MKAIWKAAKIPVMADANITYQKSAKPEKVGQLGVQTSWMRRLALLKGIGYMGSSQEKGHWPRDNAFRTIRLLVIEKMKPTLLQGIPHHGGRKVNTSPVYRYFRNIFSG